MLYSLKQLVIVDYFINQANHRQIPASDSQYCLFFTYLSGGNILDPGLVPRPQISGPTTDVISLVMLQMEE